MINPQLFMNILFINEKVVLGFGSADMGIDHLITDLRFIGVLIHEISGSVKQFTIVMDCDYILASGQVVDDDMDGIFSFRIDILHENFKSFMICAVGSI